MPTALRVVDTVVEGFEGVVTVDNKSANTELAYMDAAVADVVEAVAVSDRPPLIPHRWGRLITSFMNKYRNFAPQRGIVL